METSYVQRDAPKLILVAFYDWNIPKLDLDQTNVNEF